MDTTFSQSNTIISKRHPVDVLRVRYWHHGLMQSLGYSTSYQVEKHFDAKSFKRENKRTTYPNKWSRYAQGMHTPQVRLVRRVEAVVVGSARELNHPLWAILKTMGSKHISVADWMGRLDPAVQACVLQPQHDYFGAPRILASYSARQGQKLLRRGNLDALAALVLYWIDARHRNHMANQEELASMIYQLLLIIGIDFFERQLNTELLALFSRQIFNETPWLHGTFAIDAQAFEISIFHLYCLSEFGNPPITPPSWLKCVRNKLALLSGSKGLDVYYAMKPLCIPAWEMGPPTFLTWAQWEEHRRLWAWGWYCLLNNEVGKFPPSEISVRGTLDKRGNILHCYSPEPLDFAVFRLFCEYGQWPPREA